MASRYFSSVRGHAVSRFGHPDLLIGAERDPKAEGGLRWETDRVIEIPEAEFTQHEREYRAALRAGGLVERKPEDLAGQAQAEARRAAAETSAKSKAKE
jgi:hypothetical protein